ADTPIFEHLRLRVWIGRDAIVPAVLLRPLLKCRFVPLKVQMGEEQRVIRHLPERILVPSARPLIGRTSFDCFSKHRERRVILAFQPQSKRGVGYRHADHSRSGMTATPST